MDVKKMIEKETDFLRTIIAFIILACLFGCVQKPSPSNQIIGYWKAILDETQLLKLGMKGKDIHQSAAEMKFNKEGTMEIRVIDPVNLKDGKATKLIGEYKIMRNRLKMSFGKGVWEDQKITIVRDVMSLEPKEYNGKIVNRFKRINSWSLVADVREKSAEEVFRKPASSLVQSKH